MVIILVGWVIFGIWFYSSARKLGARPWLWVLLMLIVSWATSVQLFPLLYDVLTRALPPLWGLFFALLLAADIGTIVALHAFMVRRVPFRNGEPLFAGHTTICSNCGAAIPKSATACASCGTQVGAAT